MYVSNLLFLKGFTADADIVLSGQMMEGDAVTYACREGFLIYPEKSKSKTLTCQSNGSWDGVVPLCESKRS